MGVISKGHQQQFIFSKQDLKTLINAIVDQGFVFLEGYLDEGEEKRAIVNADEFTLTVAKAKYRRDNSVPQLFVIPGSNEEYVLWREISLKEGGKKYSVDPQRSHAVQLLISNHTADRITVGRISVLGEWWNEKDESKKATIELGTYNSLKRLIKEHSGSKMGGILIGKDATELALSGNIALSYDLNNPETYDISKLKAFKHKRHN